ncbi:flagellar export chaperone FlgN [Brenneria populi]|uniref:Flagellar export chaperone FlgN n=1 Tax=Brenneria populi TaxID=1505588 RepID=A0ABU6JWE6_9GAMM|nr:flagellar export chaperone FlgN [Brenneria populi Li et al. 2015]
MTINAVLQKMLELLHELQETLQQEELELSAKAVNSALLHRVTENKNEQLTSLRHFDAQRQTLEQQNHLSAPYSEQNELNALWSEIQALTQTLSQNNHRNALLLRQHMKYTNETLALLKTKSNNNLYGPDGYSSSYSGNKFSG